MQNVSDFNITECERGLRESMETYSKEIVDCCIDKVCSTRIHKPNFRERLNDCLKCYGAWNKTDSLCSDPDSYKPEPTNSPITCPPIYDRFLCWEEMKPGTAYKSCREIREDFNNKNASKVCLPNGTWFKNDGKYWTNYSQCLTDHKLQIFIQNMNIAGYTISIFAVIISLMIFTSFRSLQCSRIKVHIQFFISFLLCNLMLLCHECYTMDDSLYDNNPIWCQVFHILIQYGTVTNYFWMLCEGLHLYLALVVVFIRETIIMKWFHFIGWGIPALIIFIYSATRGIVPEERIKCWSEPSGYSYLYSIPVEISLIINFLILIKVFHLLLQRPSGNSNQVTPIAIKRAFRAVFILIPLLGIQHLIYVYRPDTKSPFHATYEISNCILTSLQGFMVASIFCFANMDVHSAIRSAFFCRSRSSSLAPITTTRETW